jgi:hypothetical protein
MVFIMNISVNTLHKGDDDDNSNCNLYLNYFSQHWHNFHIANHLFWRGMGYIIRKLHKVKLETCLTAPRTIFLTKIKGFLLKTAEFLRITNIVTLKAWWSFCSLYVISVLVNYFSLWTYTSTWCAPFHCFEKTHYVILKLMPSFPNYVVPWKQWIQITQENLFRSVGKQRFLARLFLFMLFSRLLKT